MTGLILHNRQAPGDALMLSCAVRDLHLGYPGEYEARVVVPAADIFLHNPYIATKQTCDLPTRVIGYTNSITSANRRVGHFCSGFVQGLSEILGRRVRLTALRADVHLTDEEKDPANCPVKPPYWLAMAGGKRDFTAKIWHHSNWQQVVSTLTKDVPVVQVGRSEHKHTALSGVVNLLDRTTLRQLMVLAYHAEGAICHVTCLMHLMAAFNKPCVVIAGGREPWWWEAYNETTWRQNAINPVPNDFVNHAYLHTIGAMECCKKGGCFMCGIGEKLSKNCLHVDRIGGGFQAACLSRITPAEVLRHTHNYMNGIKPPALPEPEGLQEPLWDLELKPPTVPVPLAVRKAATPVPHRSAVSVTSRQQAAGGVLLSAVRYV